MMASTEYVSIKPDVHFLRSIIADRGSWWILSAEAIDNALDKGATQVSITLSKSVAAFTDNGIGISREHELAIVTLGQHRPSSTNALGRFGVGITYNAISAARQMDVVSVSRDGRLDLTADWEAMLTLGEWLILRPIWTAASAKPLGTVVTLHGLRWPKLSETEMQKTRDQLAAMFRPAIAAGKRITLNGEAIPWLEEPALLDIVALTVQMPSGKSASVRGGLLQNPEQSVMHSVNVVYGHRVIEPRSMFGADGFSGLRRMFAEIRLIDAPDQRWGLRRFKDGVDDPEADLLEERVTEALRPIFERCHSAQMSTTIEDMAGRLNEMLPADLVGVVPLHKKKRDDKNTTERKRPSQQHRPANGPERPRGPARARHRGLMIEFDGPLADEAGYGWFRRGKPNKIVMAKDNPDIAEWLSHRDRIVAARALYAVAMMLYEQARERGETTEEGQLPSLDGKPFGLRAWELAKSQKPQKGVPA